MKKLLQYLFEHKTLTREQAREVLVEISEGKYNEHEITSFVTVYLMRSITIEELMGFRDALLSLAVKVNLGVDDALDIVGTGGDGKDTFNISTLAPERTFLEKLLFIHETLEGFNKGSERKSRHYYDLLKLYNAGVFERIKNNRELLQMVVEHRQTFFRYNTLDYEGISSNGVRVVPSKESWTDWRGDYTRTAVMIYKDIPSFVELISFAKQSENEFNEWVKNHKSL